MAKFFFFDRKFYSSKHYSRKTALDIVLLLILSAIAFVGVCVAFDFLTPAVLHRSTFEYWFESDIPDVYNQFVSRWGYGHLRTHHHPLFSLFVFPLTYSLRLIFNLTPTTAVGYLMAALASLWIATFYILLRTLKLKPIDATVFCSLATTSACAIFWFSVPETYSFGALSLALIMIIVVLSERYGPLPTLVYILVSALALAITSTNWIAALIMLFVLFSWKKAFRIAVASMCIVILTAVIQKALIPQTRFFFNIFHMVGGTDSDYLFNPGSLGFVSKANAFFFHSIIVPKISESYGTFLSVQAANSWTSGLLTSISTIIWILLIALAVIGSRKLKISKFFKILVFTILGQLALYLVFGLETFLYSLHFGPLLVMFSAISAQTHFRKVAVPLAAVLTVLAGFVNVQRFLSAGVQLEQRYQHNRVFAEKVNKLTKPESLIIHGTFAQAAYGIIKRRDFIIRPIKNIVLLTRFGIFRKGWDVNFEDWSIDLVKNLQEKGAKYFVTAYGYGLDRNSTFLEEMKERFRLIERSDKHYGPSPKWVVFDLDYPSAVKSSD